MCCYTHPVVRVVSSEQAVVLGWVGGGILNLVGCLCVWLLALFWLYLFTLYTIFLCYISGTCWYQSHSTTWASGLWYIFLAPRGPGYSNVWRGQGWWITYSVHIHMSMSRVVSISWQANYPVASAWLRPPFQSGCWLMPQMGRSSVSVGGRIQDTWFLVSFCCREAYLRRPQLVGLVVSVDDQDVDHAVRPLLSQFPDDQVPLLIWFHQCPWLFSVYFSTGLHYLTTLHGKIWCDERVVLHMSCL